MKEVQNTEQDSTEPSGLKALLMPTRTRGGGAACRTSADSPFSRGQLTGSGQAVLSKQQAGRIQHRSSHQPDQALSGSMTQPPPGLLGKQQVAHLSVQGPGVAALLTTRKEIAHESEDEEEWLIPTVKGVNYMQGDESNAKMYGAQDAWSLGVKKLDQIGFRGSDGFTKAGIDAGSKGGDGSKSPSFDVCDYSAAEDVSASALAMTPKRLLCTSLRRSREKTQKGMLGQQTRNDPGSGVSRYELQPDDCVLDEDELMFLFKRSYTNCDDEEMGEAGELSLQELLADPSSNFQAPTWDLNAQADLQPQGNNTMQLARVELADNLAALYHAMSSVQLRTYVKNHPENFSRQLSRAEVAILADLNQPPGKLDTVSIQKLCLSARDGELGILRFIGQGSVSLQLTVDGQAHTIVEKGHLRLYGKTAGGPARLIIYGPDRTQRLLELFVATGDKSVVDKAEVLFTCQHMAGIVIVGVPVTKEQASNGMLRFTALQYDMAQRLQHHLDIGTA